MVIFKLLFSSRYFYYFVFIFIITLIILFIVNKDNIIDHNKTFPYKKRQYIFDNYSEFKFYKLLLKLFGDKYYIFPQVNYSHLIEENDYRDWGARSKIDKKSADFVFCDKEHVVPRLVIELDGTSHNNIKRQRRDVFIDNVMNKLNFEIIHISTKDSENEDLIKSKLLIKLKN